MEEDCKVTAEGITKDGPQDIDNRGVTIVELDGEGEPQPQGEVPMDVDDNEINEKPKQEDMRTVFYEVFPHKEVMFEDGMTVFWTPTIPVARHHLFNPAKEPVHIATSPDFTLAHPSIMCPSKWKMQLMSDAFFEHKRTIAIYLWRQQNNYNEWNRWDDPPNNLNVKYKVQILGLDDIPVFSKESGERIFSKGDCYGWKNFALFDKVLPHVTNDWKIKVKLELKLCMKFQYVPLSHVERPLYIHIDGITDTLTTNKGVILCKCFPFRQALNKLESDADHLFLPSGIMKNVDAKDVTNMLKFLHWESCPPLEKKDTQDLFPLWRLATRFGLALLKCRIFQRLVHEDCLNLRNITPTVLFVTTQEEIKTQPQYAKSYNKLKKFVIENMDKISNSRTFKTAFTNPALAEEYVNLVLEPYRTVPTFPTVVPIKKPCPL